MDEMIYTCIYFGFQTLFFTSLQTSNTNGHIDVNLIHLSLLQHEQMLVKIQIAQIIRGGGAEG
jgi:hypothetical protein